MLSGATYFMQDISKTRKGAIDDRDEAVEIAKLNGDVVAKNPDVIEARKQLKELNIALNIERELGHESAVVPFVMSDAFILFKSLGHSDEVAVQLTTAWATIAIDPSVMCGVSA